MMKAFGNLRRSLVRAPASGRRQWHGVANSRVASARLEAFPVLEDNYSYALIDEASQEAVVIDAGDASTMTAVAKRMLEDHFVETTQLWTTHKHWDHAGGNAEMSQALKIPVVGPAAEKVEACTVPVTEGDTVRVGGLSLEVWEMPCHTQGHVAFYLPPQRAQLQPDDREQSGGTSSRDSPNSLGAPLDLGSGIIGYSPLPTDLPIRPAIVVPGLEEHGAILAGDVLFSQGCGRFFEGTAEQMLRNADRMLTLPDSVLLCCGHEYTLTNSRFAAWLEPGNEAVQAREAEVDALRRRALPTVPSAMGREKGLNPFLRARDPRMQQAVRARALETLEGAGDAGPVSEWAWEDPVVVMGAMRRMRESW